MRLCLAGAALCGAECEHSGFARGVRLGVILPHILSVPGHWDGLWEEQEIRLLCSGLLVAI